jgi:TPP-dependent pyruvate/acetoin dehydrogenase alpha subunit
MGGFLHLYIGQESVAMGACSLMGDNDHVIPPIVAMATRSPWA